MALSERDLKELLNPADKKRRLPKDIPSEEVDLKPKQIIELLDLGFNRGERGIFEVDSIPAVAVNGILKPPYIVALTTLAKPPYSEWDSPHIKRLVEEVSKNPFLPQNQSTDNSRDAEYVYLSRIIKVSSGKIPSQPNLRYELSSLSFIPDDGRGRSGENLSSYVRHLDDGSYQPLDVLLATQTPPYFSEESPPRIIAISRFCSTRPFIFKPEEGGRIERALQNDYSGLAYVLMNWHFLQHAKDYGWDIPIDYLTARIDESFARRVSHPPLTGKLVPPFVPAYRTLNLAGPAAIQPVPEMLAAMEKEEGLTLQIMAKGEWQKGLADIINKVKYGGTSGLGQIDCKIAPPVERGATKLIEPETDQVNYSSLQQSNLRALIAEKGPELGYLLTSRRELPTGSVEHLHVQLLSHFLSNDQVSINLDLTKLSVAERSSAERMLAATIVSYAYNSLYNPDRNKVLKLGYDSFDNFASTHTLVAVQPYADSFPDVLGTFRAVTGDKLDIFELFRMKKGLEWPHLMNDTPQKAVELGRFALHPIFDLLAEINDRPTRNHINLLKRLVLRKLWPMGIKLARDAGGEIPYFVLAPHIYNFVVSAGIVPERVTGVEPNPSEYSRSIRTSFRKYWQPDASEEEQPAVYIAPTKIQPITWKLGDRTVKID